MSATNNRIRIAHLINYLSPAGKEVGVIKLLNAMDESCFQGYLIVINEVLDYLSLDSGKVRVISLNKKEGNDPRIPFRLAKILRDEKIDIVHTHAWGTLVEGILAGKMAGSPLIIHGEHGTFHADFKRRMVQRMFFNLADHVLSVSAVLADNLSQKIGFDRKKITPILNGVDATKFKKDAAKRRHYRTIHHIDDRTVVIGTVGRRMKVKNHQLIIQAANLLRQNNYDFKMAIVGETPSYSIGDELERMVAHLQLEKYVEFFGKQDDIAGYLNMFDIFVLPSLSEGCSNVIQEAMATELPALVSDVGGNLELVEDEKSGLLFRSNDVQDFTAALERLMNDRRLCEQLGQNARARMDRDFSLEAMIGNYTDFYLNKLADKKRRKGKTD